jgi:hypothetical protein
MFFRMALFAAIALVAMSARADCGGQSYFLYPSSASTTTLRKTIGVLEIGGLSKDATGEMRIHRFPGSTTAHVLAPGKFIAVGHMPTCRQDYALDGDQFAIVEARGDYLRIVPDSRHDATVWISLSETTVTYKSSTVMFFRSLPQYAGIDIFFGRDRVKVYKTPSPNSPYEILDGGQPALGQRSAYKMLHESNGFIEIGDGGWEGEPIHSLGWVRIRERGKLAIWLSYYDDC